MALSLAWLPTAGRIVRGAQIGGMVIALLIVTEACGSSHPAAPTADQKRRTEFYVSPSGDDRNDGSLTSPWRSLRSAIAQLRPGDTLYLRGGVYTGAMNTIDSQVGTVPSGTSWSAPITIAGFAQETATIQPPDNTSAIRLTTGAPHYLVFQDFTIDMSNNTVAARSNGADGIYVSQGSHHNRFQRLTVRNNVVNCFQIPRTPDGVESPFNEILDSTIHTCGTGQAGENGGYGIYNSTDDTLIKGNDIYNIGGFGIASYGSRIVIRNNRIHETGTNGVTSYAIDIGSSAHPTPSSDCQIFANQIYGNRGGILIYTNSLNAQVHDNNIYGNGPLEAILVQYATGTMIRDNSIDGGGVVDLGASTRLENNRGDFRQGP